MYQKTLKTMLTLAFCTLFLALAAPAPLGHAMPAPSTTMVAAPDFTM